MRYECPQCDGDGIIDSGSIYMGDLVCPTCSGEGEINSEYNGD